MKVFYNQKHEYYLICSTAYIPEIKKIVKIASAYFTKWMNKGSFTKYPSPSNEHFQVNVSFDIPYIKKILPELNNG